MLNKNSSYQQLAYIPWIVCNRVARVKALKCFGARRNILANWGVHIYTSYMLCFVEVKSNKTEGKKKNIGDLNLSSQITQFVNKKLISLVHNAKQKTLLNPTPGQKASLICSVLNYNLNECIFILYNFKSIVISAQILNGVQPIFQFVLLFISAFVYYPENYSA